MSAAVSYLSAEEFAQLAGMSRQAASKAFRAENWRGTAIEVRAKSAPRGGGRAGIRYEVKVSSLPAYLQQRLKASRNPLQYDLNLSAPLPTGRPAGKASHGEQITWWTHHLRRLLATEPGSAERANAVDDLAGRRLLDWNKRPKTLSRTTIYKKLASIEARGLAGVARKRRSDIGHPKVIVSRAWDNAVPFDEATKRQVAESLKQQIRSDRANKVTRHLLLLLVQEWLKKERVARGFSADPAELDRICEVSTTRYSAEAKYEVVYDLTRDRDRFDNNKPRGGKRSITGMPPDEQLVGDCHPLDLLVRRPDGSVGGVTAITWMETATRRVWMDFLMVERGGGVRQLDVARSYFAVCCAWGVHSNVYVDNGGEFNFVDYLTDFIGLAHQHGREVKFVTRALAYNPQAEGMLEGFFHHFEVDYVRHVPGWHGGKLGAPQRPARGKLPKPWQVGFDALCADLQGKLATYNAVPQKHGLLAGDSPNARYARALVAGFAPVIADPSDLLTVFTKPETRIVRQHGVQVDGRTWSAPALDEYFDPTVVVRIPQLGLGFNELVIEDTAGNRLCIATPDQLRRYDDPRQAQHSADRMARTTAAARELQRSLPRTDISGRLSALKDAFGPGPAAPEPIGTVSVAVPGSAERAIIPARRAVSSRAAERALEQAGSARQMAAIAESERLRRGGQ